MKHTSFPLAKQVYDKGVRIETHFDTDPADGTIYSKEEIINLELMQLILSLPRLYANG
jgi:hypothetical protein